MIITRTTTITKKRSEKVINLPTNEQHKVKMEINRLIDAIKKTYLKQQTKPKKRPS